MFEIEGILNKHQRNKIFFDIIRNNVIRTFFSFEKGRMLECK